MVSEFNSWKELWYITLSIAPPPPPNGQAGNILDILQY